MKHKPKSSLLLVCIASALLAACVPNPNLPNSSYAPPVTGDFDEVFAPGTAKAQAFKQPTLEERLKAQVDARNQAQNQAYIKAKDAKDGAVAHTSSPYIGDLKVAVLLPHSGATKELAADLQDAAMLAVYDSKNVNTSGYSITLLPKNTMASPSVAAAVAKQAIEEGAKLIVGPLYSQEVDTVKQVAGDVPIIALTNNSEMESANCFVFGITPESEVQRVTEYAMKQGRVKFAALIPNDEYGITLEKALQANITAKGGQVENIEYFIDSDEGRKTSVKRLAEKMRITSAEAIFIADTPENSAMMLNELRALGIDMAALMLLGTSQWTNDDGKPIPIELNMGIFSGGSDRAYQRFSERFNASMKRIPNRISTLAYDAVSELAEIAKSGTVPTAEELIADGVIQGRAVGTYRYEAGGKVSRSLAIYQFTEKGVDTLETAPKDF